MLPLFYWLLGGGGGVGGKVGAIYAVEFYLSIYICIYAVEFVCLASVGPLSPSKQVMKNK